MQSEGFYGLSIPQFLRQYASAPWAPGALPGKGGGGTTDKPIEVKTTLDGADILERVARVVPAEQTSLWRVFLSPGIMWSNYIDWFLQAGGFHKDDVAQAVQVVRQVLQFNPKHANALGHLVLASLGMSKEALASDEWRHPTPDGRRPFDTLRAACKAWIVTDAPGPIRQREVTVDGRSQACAGSDSGWLTGLFTEAAEREAAAQLWITMCQRIVIKSMDSACDAMVGVVTGSTCRVFGSNPAGGSRNPSGFVSDFIQASADPTSRGVVGVFTMDPSASQSLEPGSLSWLTEDVHCVEASVDTTTVMIVLVVAWLPGQSRLEVLCAPYSPAMTLDETSTAGLPPLRPAPGCIRALIPLVMTHFAVHAEWNSTLEKKIVVDYDSHHSIIADEDEDEDEDRECHDIRKFFEPKSQAAVARKAPTTRKVVLKRSQRDDKSDDDDDAPSPPPGNTETKRKAIKRARVLVDSDSEDEEQQQQKEKPSMLIVDDKEEDE